MIENDKVVDFFRVFSNKILSKTKIGINEIHEKDIDNDDHEPVPEYDTAIEHEESNNGREVTKVQLG